MGWGIRITILYICFAAIIVSLGVISFGNKSELVSKDYYAQELKSQDRIDPAGNEQKLKTSITNNIKDRSIALSFPVTEIAPDLTGEIPLFRPSDSRKDKKIKLQFNNKGEQIISKTELSKGVYKLCISWSNNHINYYKEQIVNL